MPRLRACRKLSLPRIGGACRKFLALTARRAWLDFVARMDGVDALSPARAEVTRCGRTPGVPAPAFGSARRPRWPCVDDRLGARKKWQISNLVRCGHVFGLKRCGTHDRGP